MNDEDLCEAAIERSSGEGTESFSRGLAFIYKTKASAATPPKRPVRFLGPLSSRNIVVLPESSVAICLPEGTSRDDLWTAASGTSLRQSFAAGGSGLRHRHLFLASTLEDPTFESIYNAILLPQLVAQEASGESGDVPSSRPARSTSSSRAVSFDNSPTVMPLEPPPDPFAPCDASKEPASPPPIIRPRRRSSVCLSSSGSLVQEMTEAAELRAVLGSRHALRRRPSVLPDPESAYDCNGSAESPVLEAADLSW
ncbi:hypothetical protein V5799_025844 [Amblyomma americanum]|uniref:Uncharacterized protein n=1 Tax=Amblyomma americanum TaxID=6943 RepID=A0AAQ4E850_AMBAM